MALILNMFDMFLLQSIGYANLAKLDPQYGLCMCTSNLNS